MTHPPIMQRLVDDLGDGWQHLASHLPHYHHDQPQEGTTMTTPKIIDWIEADLSKAGKTIDADVHGILAHHLTVANMARHVADAAAVLAASPMAAVVETAAGMPPAEEAFIARAASDAADWLGALTTPAVAAAAGLPPAEQAPGAAA